MELTNDWGNLILTGEGTCKGDSGGPLFAHRDGKLVVAGVLSAEHIDPNTPLVEPPMKNGFSELKHCFGKKSEYAYVAKYYDWMNKIILGQ